MKREYIAVDDYGMGGVWMVIDARSAAEIEIRYPELDVFDSAPSFLSDESLEIARRNRHFDIDAPPSGYLRSIVDDRS